MADNGPEVYHVVVSQFAGEDRAMQVADLVQKFQKKGGYEVKAWVVVEVDEKGKAHVKQTGHGGWGAAIGGGAGLLLGLIGGPAGLLIWALGGALVGGLAGKYLGHQFDKDEIEALASAMEPNTSGLIVVVEDDMLENFEEEMGVEGGKVVTVTLSDQISGEFATVSAVEVGEPGEAEE